MYFKKTRRKRFDASAGLKREREDDDDDDQDDDRVDLNAPARESRGERERERECRASERKSTWERDDRRSESRTTPARGGGGGEEEENERSALFLRSGERRTGGRRGRLLRPRRGDERAVVKRSTGVVRPKRFFEKDDFNPDVYIDEMSPFVTPEDLATEVEKYADELQNKLVEMVNRDYKDFVALTTDLVDVDKYVKDLKNLWKF